MPRRSLGWIDSRCCYHVTQRCQERRFLLRFKRDRRQYLRRLREAAARYPVSVLNYMPTGNHVHLLVRCERPGHLSSAMQYISGSMAQDYNRRKSRQGAFWAGRFRPTLIQPGHHLSRCFFYISLNMVRAHAVTHPSEWVGGSHAELLGQVPAKDRIIDRQALLHCLECGTWESFGDWYARTIAERCRAGRLEREPFWSEAAAVGDREWIEELAGRFPSSWRRVEPVQSGEDSAGGVAEAGGTYMIRMSNRRREGLLASL